MIVLETRDGPLPLIPTEVVVVPSGEDGEDDGGEGIGGGGARIGAGARGSGAGARGSGAARPRSRVRCSTSVGSICRRCRWSITPREVRRRRGSTRSGTRGGDVLGPRSPRLRSSGRVLHAARRRRRGMERKLGDFGRRGEPVFTDVNIISGMEQTSFLFLQAAEVGLSHSGVLRHALASARRRVDASLPSPPKRERRTRANARMDDGEVDGESTSSGSGVEDGAASSRRRVYVLFGGGTSERQVSLVSGVNVWLKLRARAGVRGGASAPGRHARGRVARKHPRVATSVRVRAATHRGGGCRGGDDARDAATRALVDEIRKSLRLHGWAEEMDDCDAGLGAPRSETLASIAATAAAEGAVVFNVVHGGCGEDGSLQTLLASAGAAFTGSRARGVEAVHRQSRDGGCARTARLGRYPLLS